MIFQHFEVICSLLRLQLPRIAEGQLEIKHNEGQAEDQTGDREHTRKIGLKREEKDHVDEVGTGKQEHKEIVRKVAAICLAEPRTNVQ